MGDTAIQVDLVWEAGLLQDDFRFVTLLGGEDLVGLGGGDAKGATNGLEFVGFDEGRVSDVTDVDLVLFGVEVTDDVLGAEAVADGGDFLKPFNEHISSHSLKKEDCTFTLYFSRSSVILASTIGSTTSVPWLSFHLAKSKSSPRFNGTGSPLKRSGTNVKKPLAANWSAMS